MSTRSVVELPVVKTPSGPKVTDIEWATHSFNPLRAVHVETGKVGWACQKVSAGCKGCYAETLNMRFGTKEPYTAAGMKNVRVLLDERQMAAALKFRPKAGGSWEKPWSNGRAHVFIGDMTDIFGEWVPFEVTDRLMATAALTPHITWMWLTKRAERMAEYFAWRRGHHDRESQVRRAVNLTLGRDGDRPVPELTTWPLPNVWLGVSCEDQAAADVRIPHLLRCPAAVRFLSCEPLLGAIRLNKHAPGWLGSHACGIHWVIAGGESGRGARACNVEWIRSIVAQCKSAGVPVFVKQVGAVVIDRNDAGFDADEHQVQRGDGSWAPANPSAWPSSVDVDHDWDADATEYQGKPVRVRLRSKKGGDPSEWPEDLRVRQFPKGVN